MKIGDQETDYIDLTARPELWPVLEAHVEGLHRLQAIVDKLPKTADGVPVTPGTTLWFCDPFGKTKSWKIGRDLRAKTTVLVEADPAGNEFEEYGPADCYSTREAAEKAKEAVDERG